MHTGQIYVFDVICGVIILDLAIGPINYLHSKDLIDLYSTNLYMQFWALFTALSGMQEVVACQQMHTCRFKCVSPVDPG